MNLAAAGWAHRLAISLRAAQAQEHVLRGSIGHELLDHGEVGDHFEPLTISSTGCQWRAIPQDLPPRSIELAGLASARLPFGVPDPLLCGASAVALYTGGLWPAAALELTAADPGKLVAELFAIGCR
jgi:hypothetical protein